MLDLNRNPLPLGMGSVKIKIKSREFTEEDLMDIELMDEMLGYFLGIQNN